jgi:putative sterol carrier protein
MNAAEIFEQMPDAFQAEKAGNLRTTIQFNLSGEGGGDWAVAIADSTCTIIEGQAEKPELTIGMAANDFVEMIAGDLQPMVAFMQGKIRLQGDTSLALRFQELFAR